MLEQRKQEDEDRQLKTTLEEQERQEAFDIEHNHRLTLIRNETKRHVKEAAEKAQELEQRRRQLLEQQKQLDYERKAMVEQRKQEEEERRLKAALEEKERREAFEKEEERRLKLIRMETTRKVKDAQAKAQTRAREAEEARRLAQEQAELVRQQGAELELARLKAEQEANAAKKKAALLEEARQQAVREAKQAKREAQAKTKQQNRALKEAKNMAAQADKKRINAERRATLEERRRHNEELKRQKLEDSIAAGLQKKVVSSKVSDQIQSSPSESANLDDEKSSSEEYYDENDDGSYTSRSLEEVMQKSSEEAMEQSMDHSIDLSDLENNCFPIAPVKKAVAAREKKRQLENKYHLGHNSNDTAITKGSSGIPRGPGDSAQNSGYNDASIDTFASEGENGSGSPPQVRKRATEETKSLSRGWFGRSSSGTSSQVEKRAKQESKSPGRGLFGRSSSGTSPQVEKRAIEESKSPGRGLFGRSSSGNSPQVEKRPTKETKPRGRGVFRRSSSGTSPQVEKLSTNETQPRGRGEFRRSSSGTSPQVEKRPTKEPKPRGREIFRRSTSLDASRIGLQRQGSLDASRMGVQRQASWDASQMRMKRQGSRPGMARQRSAPGIRDASSDTNRAKFHRGPSHRSVGPRSRSVDALQRQSTARPDMKRARSSAVGDFAKYDVALRREKAPEPRKKKKRDMKYERPPRSLVLIWLLVAGELSFDLCTTVITFRSIMEDNECCGYDVVLGPVPMLVAIPFFLLVSTELALLIRAIVLTLFPNIMMAQEEARMDAEGNVVVRSTCRKILCCCFRWNVRMIMRFMGFLILMNPFFGCFIAWMLLYTSDKTESFTVLGLEGGSLLLHYVSVCLEGSITNFTTFLIHGLLPLVPFAVGVGMVLFYLKQGGVCYVIEEATFRFNGCEVCLNGYPPVDGVCTYPNGTTYLFENQNVFGLENYNSFKALEGITSRTLQVSYCADQNPNGPDTNFCFFDFEDGQLDGVVQSVVETQTESSTLVPSDPVVQIN